MNGPSLNKHILRTLPIAVLAMLSATAYATHDFGAFELDGNAEDQAAVGDDWNTPPDEGDANVFTGITPDPSPVSIFTGGRKDIQNINQWSHKSGEVPDKDDITNAYAAGYNVDGDLIVYFGADRLSNVGDAFLGFWFFKQNIVANPNGSFTGLHTAGDTLVLVNFPQASNAVPYIAVVVWDTLCTGADGNNPDEGDCAAQNLRLVKEGSGLAGAVCGYTADDDACAITNSGTVTAPWDYTTKDGTSGAFPYESFYEGGINLTELVGGDSCFSSFMAESRSSSSFTASLKDFVLHGFELCSVRVTKVCGQGDLNASETGFVYPFSGTVTNDGFGTLYDVVVTDDAGTPGNTSDDIVFPIGTLAKDASAPFSGEFGSTQNPPTNTVHVKAAGSAGGPQTITDTASDACEPVNRDPAIEVTKTCETSVVELEGRVAVQVNFAGQVCNTSSGVNAISLSNVTVTDDGGTPGNTADDQVFSKATLTAGQCKTYSGSYLPASVNGPNPGEVSFSDTVTATGTAPLGFGSASDSKTASCPLCPVVSE